VTEAKQAKKEETPNASNVQNAVAIIATIVVLILISFFAYKYLHKEPPRAQLIYNNFEFNKVEGMWHTQWQKKGQVYDIGMRYNPLEVEDVSVGGVDLNITFRKLPQYITFDPRENTTNMKYIALGVGELGLNLVRGLGGRIEMACTVNGSDACMNHSIVTCDDADKGVYLLRTAEQPRVILAGNCLILEGKELDLIRAIDRILYTFYGIIA
jgi:hypothetical protein